MQNLDAVIISMGKDPKAFKDRVELAEEAVKDGDNFGAFVELQQGLAIQEDPAVRAKLDAIAKTLP